MRIHTISALLAVLSIAGGPLGAQDSASVGASVSASAGQDLVPGSRVWFSVLDAGGQRDWMARRLVVRGTLTDVRSDSLVLELGGHAGRTAVARSALVDLSISRGMQRGWRAHPERTLISGLMLASSVALVALSQNDSRRTGRGSNVAVNGAFVGFNAYFFSRTAFSKTEKWERVR